MEEVWYLKRIETKEEFQKRFQVNKNNRFLKRMYLPYLLKRKPYKIEIQQGKKIIYLYLENEDIHKSRDNKHNKQEVITKKEEKNIKRQAGRKRKTIQKIEKLLVDKEVKNVVLDKKLEKENEVRNYIERNNIDIQNGRRILKYMVYNILEYIADVQEIPLESQSIHILVNDNTSINQSIIIELARKLKRVDIVTNHIKQFRKLEEYLDDKLGIMITVGNNKRKCLVKEKWILNVDFPIELIRQYRVNPNSLFINLENPMLEIPSRFNGIILNSYEIQMKEELETSLKNMGLDDNFDMLTLYESIRMRKDSYENIQKDMEQDEIKIKRIKGINGYIQKKDFERIKESGRK